MDRASFETYIKNTMESWDCPGVAIAIVKENEVVYRNAFGFRDVQQQLPLTVDTRFPLASVTKSFTAMSAALLVDDGLLEWDKPVCHYMPEFILDDPYITRHITVRDMLSHRTGLPRHDKAAWRLDLPLAEFIKRMRHLKFSATFRERYQYNNLMYAATGYPDFDVKLENGQLQACTVGSHRWSELRHYQYDIFEWHVVAWDYWLKVKFQINEAGEVGSVSIPIEPDVANVDFARKPVVIDEPTLAAIAGQYDTEIAGLVFSISCKNGKLYWQDLNQPIEAQACGNRGTEVEFRVNRSRAVFYQTDGKFTRVALKTPEATYEGHRR